MSINSAQYATLLATNPSRLYGIYGNGVYDFTDFYTAILPITPGMGVQDVRIRNTDLDVANAINTLSAGAYDNIFSLIEAGDLVFTASPYNIIIPASPNDIYDPTDVILSNDDARALLNGAQVSPWLVRNKNTFYDITYDVKQFPNTDNPPELQVSWPYATTGMAGPVPTNTMPLNTDVILNESFKRDPNTVPSDELFKFPESISDRFTSSNKRINRIGYAREWVTQGAEIIGPIGDSRGYAVAISRDGTTIATARNNNPNPWSVIDVYRFISGSWTFIGSFDRLGDLPTILGDGRRFVALSDNGNTIAFGDPEVNFNQGTVRILTYSGSGFFWNNKGSTIISGVNDTYLGVDVALSGDGNVVAIANSPLVGNHSARVWRFDDSLIIPDWVQTNFVQPNTTVVGAIGLSLALSFDGLYLAVGDGRAGGGFVRVYTYNEIDDYDFENEFTQFYGPTYENYGISVDLSSNGQKIVIGANGNTNVNINRGIVEVYERTGMGWVIVGDPIIGDQTADLYGTSVSISSDGSRISIGSVNGDVGTSEMFMNIGYVNVLEYNASVGVWDKIGAEIALTNMELTDYSFVNRLTGNGDRVIVGAPGRSAVRVATFDALPATFDNTYSNVSVGSYFAANIITDTDARGTDNDPTNLPIEIDEITIADEFILAPFTSLPPNPNFGVMGHPTELYEKEKTVPDGTGDKIYINSDGSLLYLGVDIPPIPRTSTFQYTIKNTLNKVSSPATIKFDLVSSSFLPLTISPATPATVLVTRNANSLISTIDIQNGMGTLTISEGLSPYFIVSVPSVGPNAPGNFTYDLNIDMIDYNYVVNTNYNTVGTQTIDFVITVGDSQASQDTETSTLKVTTTINPPLIFIPPNPTISQAIGQSPVTSGLSGTFNVTGGSPQPTPSYQFVISNPVGSIQGITNTSFGTYGKLVITNNITGTYVYTPTSIPTSIGTYYDKFVINVQDASDDIKSITFSVQIVIYQPVNIFALVPIADQGIVSKSENGNTVVQSGLAGNLIVVPGSGTAQEYGVVGGIPSGLNNLIVTTSNGIFTINKGTGAYTYVVTTTLGNTIATFRDSFTLNARSTTGATAITPYTVTFEIRPQMLLGTLSPSAGSIRRNNQPSPDNFIGLSGKIIPAVGNAIGQLSFLIIGGIPAGQFLVVADGSFCNLVVNTYTGEYAIDLNSLNISTVPGVYLDQFQIRVQDSDTPPNVQILIYNVTATVIDTPLGLLPIFRDATSREIAGYWNFLVHDATTSSSITPSGTIKVPNTEILIVGQTETQMTPVNLLRDTDTVIRQLLGSAAYDRTNPGDVLNQIKNNNQDVLDTDNVDGVQTRSLQLARTSGTSILTFVAEISDVLSTQHSSFLLNRYRSNVGECVIVIYADDAVSSLPNSEATRILNQIELLLDLGIKTIIPVMMAVTKNPAIASEKMDLENIQAVFLNQIQVKIGNRSVQIRSVIVRYLATTNRFQNIAGSEARPSTSPEIIFNITGYVSYNLFGALTQITIIPQDSTNPEFRIVIKSVDVGLKSAVGDIVYGSINSTSSTTFVASRTFTDTTNQVFAYGGITVDTTGFDVATGQVPEVSIRQGSNGKNVTQLKPGDVLYKSGYAYRRPVSARILISVVSGYKEANIAGKILYMQIDDGVRLPNNPVFQVKAKTTTPIIRKFNSKTLASVPISDNSIEFGFDYEIIVEELNASPSAGGLERYIDFSRLGFVTLYFGSSVNNTPIFNSYGRGAVMSITRS